MGRAPDPLFWEGGPRQACVAEVPREEGRHRSRANHFTAQVGIPESGQPAEGEGCHLQGSSGGPEKPVQAPTVGQPGRPETALQHP